MVNLVLCTREGARRRVFVEVEGHRQVGCSDINRELLVSSSIERLLSTLSGRGFLSTLHPLGRNDYLSDSSGDG